ncbi:ribokinase [Pseudoroseicyclus aestuarii]|uniref:Ribokinase n=1 Tax=Pseudoroseicyclus aestuarii TaxID=1795041 RepID=A0A318SYJ7_9RHOB|nr:ribokinase [Pseudoroseicyclus aestuarii]PYE84907.1 ribokinase [Pseudoroseicyclus aestuarii]
MTVAVFGSVNLDLAAHVATLPAPGETIHALGFDAALGGKGANQAVAAARLAKGPVRFAAAVGTDANAAQIRRELEANGAPLGDLRDFPGGSGLALIQIDAAGQNAITVVGGANMAWPDEGPGAAFLEGVDTLVLQLEVPLAAVRRAASMAREREIRVILDPAPVGDAEATRALLPLADVVTPNESEAAALLGWRPTTLDEARRAAQELRALGPGLAVVKLGEKGLAYAAEAGSGEIAPFRVTGVDSVAAGDAFCGALSVALDEGQGVEAALRFASACGALTATRRGAAASIPDRDEVERFLAAQDG